MLKANSAAIAAGRKPASALLLPLFAAALLMSAFLLFSIQPMYSKMVLPVLGGSPIVWSFSLVFFQAAVLAGYAYAHVLAKFTRPVFALCLHAFVLSLGLAALPVMVPDGWAVEAGSGSIAALAAVYGLGVGLPVFAISATAPLLQSWFSRTGHEQAHDPYFLYGASNIGSFAALALYPFLIEPLSALGWQIGSWTYLYIGLAALIVACGLMSHGARAEGSAAAADSAAPLAWSDRLRWIGLAAVPSGLLVAVTAHIAADVVSAPFVWVVPLALFLLTFVVVFRTTPLISHTTVLTLHAAVAAPLTAILFFRAFVFATAALHLAAFFIAALVCHGELARRRPAAGHLTEFYLLMSVGGVLGGIFASLVAPYVFSRIYEYPVLLVAVFACRADFWDAVKRRRSAALLPAIAAAAVIAFVGFGGQSVVAANDIVSRYIAYIALALAVAIFVARTDRVAQAGFVALTLCVMCLSGVSRTSIETARSLFGVHMVLTDPAGRFHLLAHGTTLHGAQRWQDDQGLNVSSAPHPIAYYYEGGPYEAAITSIRAARAGFDKVGIMGLGSGGLSCYQRGNETWRFFEIDSEVERIARDPSLFTFLEHCPADVVLGDGRLTIANEADASYDLLIMDAFTSDSIPVHLLTSEAFDVYRKKLKPDGVILFHVSNRYMELGSVVASLAASKGEAHRVNTLAAADWPDNPADRAIKPWIVLVGKKDADFGAIATDPRWRAMAADALPAPWTDSYSNVIGAIYRHVWVNGGKLDAR